MEKVPLIGYPSKYRIGISEVSSGAIKLFADLIEWNNPGAKKAILRGEYTIEYTRRRMV